MAVDVSGNGTGIADNPAKRVIGESRCTIGGDFSTAAGCNSFQAQEKTWRAPRTPIARGDADCHGNQWLRKRPVLAWVMHKAGAIEYTQPVRRGVPAHAAGDRIGLPNHHNRVIACPPRPLGAGGHGGRSAVMADGAGLPATPRPAVEARRRSAILGCVFVALLAWRISIAPHPAIGTPAEQVVPFSHKHHVGDVGLDCRYCHTSVEQSAFAGIPPTHTCMTCHSQLFTQQPMLAPVVAELAQRRAAAMESRPRPARLRLFQPQHPHRERRRLRDVPWPRRSHAAHVARRAVADAMVPRLPSRAGKIPPAGRARIRHGLEADGRPAGTRARAW